MSSLLNNIEISIQQMDYPIYFRTTFADKVCEYVYKHPLQNLSGVSAFDILTSPIDISGMGLPEEFVQWLNDCNFIYTSAFLNTGKYIIFKSKADIALLKARYTELYYT